MLPVQIQGGETASSSVLFWSTSALLVVVAQSLSYIRLFVTSWSATCQAPLSFTISQSLLKLMSIELVMPFNHLILFHPLLQLPSMCPTIRVFSNESALHIGGQSTGASASATVLPVNIQDWFALKLTGLSSRDSQESSPASQFYSIKSSALRLLYSPTLTSVHDYWKNHSYDYLDLWWQNDVSAFYYTV